MNLTGIFIPVNVIPLRSLKTAMANHDQHHYNPRFWLNAWNTLPDGLMSKFFWDHGKFKHERRSSKLIGRQQSLYALRSESDRNVLERDFFGKEIDNPGAEAHQAILANGVDKLTDRQVSDWARFVGMQIIRSPKAIASAREQGRSLIRQMLNAQGSHPVRGLPEGQSLADYMEAHYSHLIDDVGPLSLPITAKSARFIENIRDAYWATLRLEEASHGFLIGDYPVIYDGAINAEFVIALPLTPRVLYLAFSNELIGENFASIPYAELVDMINLRMVDQAEQFVCGVHESQAAFVQQHWKPELKRKH